MAKKEQNNDLSCRLNKVGGEAVVEGVMMKAKDRVCTACRAEDGKIGVVEQKFVSIRQKHKIFRLPLLRGIVNFIESMILSFSVLGVSAELAIEEEVEESKFEKWIKKHFGASIYDIVMFIAGALGIALALFLFTYLPNQIALWTERLFRVDLGIWKAVLCGVLRITIFIIYIALVSLMKDIKRTFAYHGAEHKSIACYEAGEELTPENAKKFTRFHPRCGTSFIFVMLLLSILVSLGIRFLCEVVLDWNFAFWSIDVFGRDLSALIYTLIGILILPIIVGLGFEFLMYAGKHNGPVVRFLSAPGLWMQRLTTREPDEEQLEVAIVALKCALYDEFPDFSKADYVVRDEYTNPPEKKKKKNKKDDNT
ncbi:MAG: DUF1385 domain-containing protein [Clostridia bacterium]|nr:DUF1385 domain-containing protein [Clostridia bacterium]